MPYSAAVCRFSSVSTLTILILPSYSSDSSSRMGATMRHGPHQVAQKSTKTGMSESRTSALKVSSVTLMVLIRISLSVVQRVEVGLGVERSRAARAGRGDRLAVGVV